MIMVSIEVFFFFFTFEWASLRTFTKMPKSDVFLDGFGPWYCACCTILALAVLIGVILCRSNFSLLGINAKRISSPKIYWMPNGAEGNYKMYGPAFLWFSGSFWRTSFLNYSRMIQKKSTFDFAESRIVRYVRDRSSLIEIDWRYLNSRKNSPTENNLSPDCRKTQSPMQDKLSGP